ncbi:MAG: RNA polymerase sigma factor, partial [bacterium]|nr:RNA polymerase sigma factor [bacterium]
MSTPSDITPEALLAHSDWIRHLVAGLVRDPGRTDDVLQETWLIALQRPPQEEGNLRGWLASVARSVIQNFGRCEGRRQYREQAVARLEALPDTVDVIAKARLQGRMVDAVLGLDEPYRSSVLLRFFEDLPPREIAERLGRPVNTVRTHIARGLAQLRTELDAEFGDRESWGMAFLPLLWGGKSQAAGGTALAKTG